MARYFTAKITSGNAIGPFTIYYNTISTSTVATVVLTLSPAINIQRSELTRYQGVEVSLPDSATSVIIYSNSCGTNYTYTLPPPSPPPSPTPSVSISITPTVTPTVTSTPNKSPSPTPTMTVTPTPTRSPSIGFVFCLGYDANLCDAACQNYYLIFCPSPSPTPTPTLTPTVTPSPPAPLCLGYHSSNCAQACSNYYIVCGVNPSPSPTPSVTPSLTPSSSPTTFYSVDIRGSVESYVWRVNFSPGADYEPGSTYYGVLYYYNVSPANVTFNVATAKWNYLPFMYNYLIDSGGSKVYFDAYNPNYNNTDIKRCRDNYYKHLNGNNANVPFTTCVSPMTVDGCQYIASINGIKRGDTLRIITIGVEMLNPSKYLGYSLSGLAGILNYSTIGPIRHASYVRSACPAFSFTTKKNITEVFNVGSNFSVSLSIPTIRVYKTQPTIYSVREFYAVQDSNYLSAITPDLDCSALSGL